MQLLSLCTLALASAAFGAKTTPLRANAPTRQGGMGGGDTGERAAGNAAANDAEDVDVDCGENQIARTNKRGVTFCKCARGFSPDTELMEELDDDELVCTEAISYCKSGRNYQQQKDKDCVCKGEELIWTEMPYVSLPSNLHYAFLNASQSLPSHPHYAFHRWSTVPTIRPPTTTALPLHFPLMPPSAHPHVP